MKIGTAQEIKSIDKSAINDYKIPGILLMETASLKVLNNIDLDKNNSFTIICGNGNNGGDGLALSRLLYCHSKKVNIFLLGKDKGLSDDCRINLDILKNLGIKVIEIHKGSNLKELKESIIYSDMTIDAIFGIGLNKKIADIYIDVVECINRYSKYIISIDIPSGLDSDTGNILGSCVKADKTVTFQLYKVGFLNHESKSYTGEVILERINIPQSIEDKYHKDVHLITRKHIKGKIPIRRLEQHKGNFGKVSIFAGSKGFTGAAYICTEAAVRCGAGLVRLITSNDIQGVLSSKVIEAMTATYDIEENYRMLVKYSDAIALGPGMGNNGITYRVLKYLLNNFNKPILIDADGLNVLQNKADILKSYKDSVVITPHPGEFARLTGYSVDYIQKNRIQVAKEFALENEVIVLLKGYNTVITDGKTTYINPTGNSSMASGGMGDCLSGIIISLLGQGVEPLEASAIGAFIHGYCGDILSKTMYCVKATDIIEMIPHILKELQK